MHSAVGTPSQRARVISDFCLVLSTFPSVSVLFNVVKCIERCLRVPGDPAHTLRGNSPCGDSEACAVHPDTARELAPRVKNVPMKEHLVSLECVSEVEWYESIKNELSIQV